MKIIPVTRPSIPNKLKLIYDFFSVVLSRNISNNGPKHQILNSKLIDFLNADYLTLFANGHLALEAALDFIEPKGGEIITTPFTFASTTQAIINKGFIPVFADIKRNDFTIDPLEIRSLITRSTVAILPVHVYGNVCDVEAIEKISIEFSIPIIYDSAHAFGVKYKTKSISSYGDINMYSFQATKVFHTIEGGALSYKNESLHPLFSATKNFGIDQNGHISFRGGNAKMSEIQAIMGLANLKNIRVFINKRKKISVLYDTMLGNIEGLELYKHNKDVVSNYSYYPILIVDNDKNPINIIDYLKKHGVLARRYFFPLTSEFPIFKDRFDSSNTPVAKFISERVICLPIYDSLKISDAKFIVSKVKEYMLL